MVKHYLNLEWDFFLPVLTTISKKPSHNHRTRYATHNLNYEVIQSCSANDRSRLKIIGPKIWMNIPLDIKLSMSVKVFVISYRNHLIGNYENDQVYSSNLLIPTLCNLLILYLHVKCIYSMFKPNHHCNHHSRNQNQL